MKRTVERADIPLPDLHVELGSDTISAEDVLARQEDRAQQAQLRLVTDAARGRAVLEVDAAPGAVVFDRSLEFVRGEFERRRKI